LNRGVKMSTLKFEKFKIKGATLGDASCLPDIKNDDYIRAALTILPEVTEKEKTYIGKGMIPTLLPHQVQNQYDRAREELEFDGAVLENEYLKATFVTSLGGRLWSLYDKKEEKELLYANDVFQPGNLALRNAWFSGGVEWNIGIKGHNMWTCSPLFAEELKDTDGTPMLRMYEFERIRGVAYSITAKLDKDVLLIHPEIENTSDEEVYMYWWSNIAVDETSHTRVISPCTKSFRCAYEEGAYYLGNADIPINDGIDVTYTTNLKRSIYVEANDRYTDEIIISADDIENVNTTSRKIEYILGNKTKTVDYSPVVKVIKNGKYFADYQKSDLMIKNGSLRLIDNDKDKKYDVIFIENYSYIIADGVLPSKNLIQNAYAEPASFDFFKVEDYSIIYNGSEITLAEVKTKDVLNILSTGTTSEDKVVIYVTREKITGKVTGRDTAEETVSIDGVEYKYSDAYMTAAEYEDENGNGDSAVTALELGKIYDVYLDRFGRIAYAEVSKKASDYEYVYATKLYEVEDGEGVFELKYFTLNSEWKNTEIADKVNYNNSGTIKNEEFVKRAKADGFKADIYRVRFNEDGKISSFEFAVETDEANVFNKKTVTGMWSVNGFGVHTDANSDRLFMLLDADSKLVLVPESGLEDEYAIGTRDLLRSDQGLTLTGYGIDEFGAADVSIYIKETKVNASSTPIVVDRVEEMFVDGESRPILYGVSGSNNDYSIVGSKPGMFDSLNSGDLIALTTGALDRAENVMVLFSPVNQYGLKMGASVVSDNAFVPGKFNTTTGFIAGFVEDISYDEYKVKLDAGEAESHVIRTMHQGATPTVYIYDMTEETLTAGKVDDIIKGDYVFMRTSWSRLTLVYVVRK